MEEKKSSKLVLKQVLKLMWLSADKIFIVGAIVGCAATCQLYRLPALFVSYVTMTFALNFVPRKEAIGKILSGVLMLTAFLGAYQAIMVPPKALSSIFSPALPTMTQLLLMTLAIEFAPLAIVIMNLPILLKLKEKTKPNIQD